MTPEQEKYYKEQLVVIRRGGSVHSAFMMDHLYGMGSKNLGPVDPPIVVFGQDGDPFYNQYFQNWDEINVMIADIRAEAEKAWGIDKKFSVTDDERRDAKRYKILREFDFGGYDYGLYSPESVDREVDDIISQSISQNIDKENKVENP
jgi:hypothetical protein